MNVANITMFRIPTPKLLCIHITQLQRNFNLVANKPNDLHFFAKK
jgi:hypothetical protein